MPAFQQYFWVFRMALMLRKFMCSLDDHIDVIPVDYCADALLYILEYPNLPDDIYHISAGEKAASVSRKLIRRCQ